MNLERLLSMATITKDVGNRRFPHDPSEADSGICVRESCCMEVHLSFWTSQQWSKEEPWKEVGRLKTEGEGFKQHWGEGCYHGAPHLGGAIPREREVGMEEGEVGNQEMLHFSRIKAGGELEGWHMRTPTIWNRGGGRKNWMQGVLAAGCEP